MRIVSCQSKANGSEGSSKPTTGAGDSGKALQVSGCDRRPRRKRLPEQKPNYPLNLWSIMKNCIGKDLTKIPMPVNFSEPLSMLQRLTEDFEYSEILDQAARCTDSCEQLSYVAAFTVSAYATTSVSQFFYSDCRDWDSQTNGILYHFLYSCLATHWETV